MADPKANDKQGYHQFEADAMREETAKGYGSFEVFWVDSDDSEGQGAGWYWWACFPGCLPDGEPAGAFATSQEAYDNAQEGA